MDTKKKNYIQKLLTLMGKSVISKMDGKVSSTRLSSFYFLLAIFVYSIGFICLEVINAIVLWKTGMPYVIPSEHIVVFGMLLAHHLTLLGINKNAETKVEQAVQDKLKSLNNNNPKDIPTIPPKDDSGDVENEEDMI